MTTKSQSGSQLQPALREDAGYFEVSGAHLYTVLHRASEPVARVLLIGPFASERQNSYLPWVRWARYLAARGFDVLRYDHRGVGESLGQFENATFSNWADDLTLLSDWFKKLEPEMPLLLHGLEIGALLACGAFNQSIGDALLLWSPPTDANQALRSALLRWVGLEQLLKPGAERKSAADDIRQLERGLSIEVEGYQWSARLWQESLAWKLPSVLGNEGSEAQERPVKIVKLPKEAAPLVKGGFVGYDEVKDFDWLFSENIKWIQEQFANRGSMSRDASRH